MLTDPVLGGTPESFDAVNWLSTLLSWNAIVLLNNNVLAFDW